MASVLAETIRRRAADKEPSLNPYTVELVEGLDCSSGRSGQRRWNRRCRNGPLTDYPPSIGKSFDSAPTRSSFQVTSQMRSRSTRQSNWLARFRPMNRRLS